VNVKDFEHVEIPEGDMLAMIFEGQQALIEKYHDIEKGRGAIVVEPENFGKIDNRFVQWRIKDLMQRTIEEMMEAANTLKNKPWKQSEVTTDSVHFYEEIADALHFFIEMCITAGMTAEDLARIYHRKHAVNQFRQESNY
jgi:phosphoribosyl-ATP pyrophosphohydrolase